MNKLTKLLSVFVIAGVVGAGTAALAGCGEKKPAHDSVKHSAVAATCTEVGYSSDYYTCNDAGCEGKYYSDAACTTEINLATITIAATGHTEVDDAAVDPTCTEAGKTAGKHCSACGTVTVAPNSVPATGHTEKYADKQDGTHSVTCEHGDLTETTEAHADTNADGKCDKCEVAVHVGTLVEEVAATCTEPGTKAHYTSTDAGCEGKLYSDATCTVEVTAEDLVIAALGHTLTGVPNLNATHVASCSVCGEPDTENKDCVDADGDDKCDVCGGDMAFTKATAAVAGTYISYDLEADIVLTETTLTFEGQEMTLSAMVNGVATCTSSGGTVYTLETNREGYTLKYTVSAMGQSQPAEFNFVPAPAKIAEYIDELVGVYSGELTYLDGEQTHKVTKFTFTAGGYVQLTEVIVGDANGKPEAGKTYYPVTHAYDVSTNTLYYNSFASMGWRFTVTKVEEGVVKEITLTKGNSSVAFTLTDETPGEVPFEMPLTDNTLYAAEGYNLTAKDLYGEKIYALNGDTLNLVDGDDTNGYLVYVYGANGEVSYLLKINATADAVELYTSDGSVKIATLAKTTQSFPELVADGTTVNNNAAVDLFNESYAYYTVKDAGWYTFDKAESDITIYTAFDETTGMPLIGVGVVSLQANTKSNTIRLEQGAKIAVDSYYKTVGFVATYSATEPEPEYLIITGSSYTINGFSSKNVYSLKGTAAAAGKYYVSVVDGGGFKDRGAYFEIGGTKYGYDYDFMTDWSVCGAGKVYSADLAAGDEVIIKVGCANEYLSLGSVTVYFETEEEYNARIEASKPVDPDPVPTEVFTADQQGTYVYEGKDAMGTYTYTFIVKANTVDYQYASGVDTLTYKSQDTGVYTFVDQNENEFTLSFDASGNLLVNDGFETYTATKSGTSSGGDPETVTGFTTEQQGTYVATYDGKNGQNTVTIVVNAESINYTDSYYAPNGLELPFKSATDGVYTCSSMFGTVKFSFVDGNISVTADQFNKKTYTAIKGEAPAFTGFTADQQGAYTYTFNNGRFDDTITITLGATSVNYKSSATAEEGIELTVTADNGVYTCASMIGNVVFSFNADGSLNVTEDVISNVAPYKATKSAASTGDNKLALGQNTLSDCDPNTYFSEVTFTATEAGDYKFDFSRVYSSTFGSTIDQTSIKPDMNGDFSTTLTLAAGQTVNIIVEHYDVTEPVYITISKAGEGGGEETTNTLSMGNNDIIITNGEGDIYTFTATEAGEYVFTYDATGYVMKETDTGAEELMSEEAVQLAEGQTLSLICYMFDQSLTEGNFTLTVAKADTTGGEVVAASLQLGENIVSEFSSAYLATETFTATEAGDYTFDLAQVNQNSYVTTINGENVSTGLTGTATKTLTLTAGQTVTIVVEQNMNNDNVIITITKA